MAFIVDRLYASGKDWGLYVNPFAVAAVESDSDNGVKVEMTAIQNTQEILKFMLS